MQTQQYVEGIHPLTHKCYFCINRALMCQRYVFSPHAVACSWVCNLASLIHTHMYLYIFIFRNYFDQRPVQRQIDMSHLMEMIGFNKFNSFQMRDKHYQSILLNDIKNYSSAYRSTNVSYSNCI